MHLVKKNNSIKNVTEMGMNKHKQILQNYNFSEI